MKYVGHPKLITNCDIFSRIPLELVPPERIELHEFQRLFISPALKALIDEAEKKLLEAKLVGDHFVRFELIVHAQEIDKEEACE